MKTKIFRALLFFCMLNHAQAEVIDVNVTATMGGAIFEATLQPEKKITNVEQLEDLSETVVVMGRGLDLFGLANLRMFANDDPWLNIRYELENLTDQQQFFSLDMRMPTLATSGPTVKDSFMNMELIDANNDGNVFVSDATSSFTVIEDNGVDSIIAQDTVGQSLFFQFITGEGSHSVIDETGVGPNSDLFEGSNGFNFMRFLTNGSISAGDKLVITAMGCYANDAINCPDRFIIPASAVPVPPAVWLFGSGLIGLIGIARRRKV